LLIVAIIESLLLHNLVTKNFNDEKEPLPPGFATTAQSHGLVSLFDKMSTALAGGPFLLLILAGLYSRTDLALLAIATDLLQKVLSFTCLPISGFVLPLLHESRGDEARFRRQLECLGGLAVFWFSIITAAVATVLPIGFPLVLGSQYAAAVPVALVWLLPLFVESAIRMVWGSGLLVTHQYGWLMIYNSIFSLAALSVVFLVKDQGLLVLLACLGGVKLIMSFMVIVQVHRKGLVPATSHPIGIVFVSATCCLISLFIQFQLDGLPDVVRLIIGVVVYSFAMLVFLKFVPLLSAPAYQALCSLAGPYAALVMRVLAAPSEAKCRA
jgi:hypothetical protein